MKYYFVRILAGFFFMGSIGIGFIAGKEYGKWIGWPIFFSMIVVSIILHRSADKIEK
jgi:hypothetical protein